MESMAATPSLHAIVLRARNLDRAGFAHGFSLRQAAEELRGPEMRGLDFGPTDSAEGRAASVRRLAEAVGFAPEDLRQAHQVHGARVVRASEAREREQADAIVADAESGPHAVAVRVADCVPILVGDRRIGAVAAIHAGWRGVVAGVIGAALGELGKIGSRDYVAAIGPCIGPCCFEVDAEIGEQIARAAKDAGVIASRDAKSGKVMVDLRRAVRAQLTAAHVHDVEDVPGCTKCDAARFFSFRRDGEASGRHLAVIAARTLAPISQGSIPL
jgi:YfiH family protein